MKEKYLKIKKLFDLAFQSYKRNNLIDAENLYKEILEINPNDVATLNNLGIVFKDTRKYDEAIFYFEKALTIKPQDIITNYNLGLLFKELEKFQKSISFYEKVIKIDSKHIQSYHDLMDIYEQTNNYEKLKKIIAEAKNFLKNNSIIKLYEGNLLYKNKKIKEAVNKLESFSFDAHKVQQERFRISILGKCYDFLKNADKAFDYFVKANDLSFELKTNNIGKDLYLKQIANKLKFFKKFKKEKCNVLENSDSRPDPIFMIGFPRSGTTLLDTILSSHPSIEVIEEKPMVDKLIYSLNELTENNYENLKEIKIDQIKKIRNVYFENLDTYVQNNHNSKIYIDKLPLNIIHVGEIYRIFPKAKFILSLRHPCDCVLSCFMQDFELNNAMANFLNLEDSAKLYDQVMKLWTQYTSIFPINYHEVKYENIILDFEPTIKLVLDFLGLSWDKSVLEYYKTAKKKDKINTPSYDQVIKPIYSEAAGRWKIYNKQIKNIYPILEPWIKKFNY